MVALVEEAAAAAAPVDEDEGREFGRGKRGREGASYRDMSEREFKKLCRWGRGAVLLGGAGWEGGKDGAGCC